MRQLWLIERVKDLSPSQDPWDPPWCKLRGAVIRAETEKVARQIVQEEGLGEIEEYADIPTPWLDPKYSTCKLLRNAGDTGVIMLNAVGD